MLFIITFLIGIYSKNVLVVSYKETTSTTLYHNYSSPSPMKKGGAWGPNFISTYILVLIGTYAPLTTRTERNDLLMLA